MCVCVREGGELRPSVCACGGGRRGGAACQRACICTCGVLVWGGSLILLCVRGGG